MKVLFLLLALCLCSYSLTAESHLIQRAQELLNDDDLDDHQTLELRQIMAQLIRSFSTFKATSKKAISTLFDSLWLKGLVDDSLLFSYHSAQESTASTGHNFYSPSWEQAYKIISQRNAQEENEDLPQ